MKKTTLAAVAIMGAPALADTGMPAICYTAVNLSAATLNERYTDESFGDAYDPAQITLKKDFAARAITKTTFLGSCEDQQKFKPGWCRVAGGSPVVWQAEVTENGEKTATVTVTYNRGGCWVDEVERL